MSVFAARSISAFLVFLFLSPVLLHRVRVELFCNFILFFSCTSFHLPYMEAFFFFFLTYSKDDIKGCRTIVKQQ